MSKQPNYNKQFESTMFPSGENMVTVEMDTDLDVPIRVSIMNKHGEETGSYLWDEVPAHAFNGKPWLYKFEQRIADKKTAELINEVIGFVEDALLEAEDVARLLCAVGRVIEDLKPHD